MGKRIQRREQTEHCNKERRKRGTPRMMEWRLVLSVRQSCYMRLSAYQSVSAGSEADRKKQSESVGLCPDVLEQCIGLCSHSFLCARDVRAPFCSLCRAGCDGYIVLDLYFKQREKNSVPFLFVLRNWGLRLL